MTTLALTDFEADLIAAVRALPPGARPAVMENVRAALPRTAAAPAAQAGAETPGDGSPLGPRPSGDPAAEAAWDAAYVREERREMRAWALADGMTAEEADEFADAWTDDAPHPDGPARSGAELVRRLGEREPLSDEAADELQEILERECGQIEWGSWDLPPGHQRCGGDDPPKSDGPGAGRDVG